MRSATTLARRLTQPTRRTAPTRNHCLRVTGNRPAGFDGRKGCAGGGREEGIVAYPKFLMTFGSTHINAAPPMCGIVVHRTKTKIPWRPYEPYDFIMKLHSENNHKIANTFPPLLAPSMIIDE